MVSVGVLNLALGLAGMILCGLSLLFVAAGVKLDRHTARRGVWFYYICLFVFAGSNLAGQLLRGHPGVFVRAGLYVSNYMEFLFPFMLLWMASRYILSVLLPDRKGKLTRRGLWVVFVVYTAMLTVSQFTGLYYVIDESNVYQRSAGYPLSYLAAGALMLADLCLLIRCRGRLNRKQTAVAFVCGAVVISSAILQIFIYGIYFVEFAYIVSGVVFYIFILSEQTERYYRQLEENAKLSTEILLAQIQPHFLYNSLGAIKAVCCDDPKRAREAIDRFSEYLQHNMNALTDSRPIPFEEALRQTRRYVELQQLRFGDDLAVAYDLQCTGFSLPTLTLQPLVENAVTYGVRKTETGRGQVTVRTREYPDRYEISVEDDGPGFVPDQLPGDRERSHIGLRNVRERLRLLCGGELRIHSVPGEGTTVTMVLPKEPQKSWRSERRNGHVDFCH